MKRPKTLLFLPLLLLLFWSCASSPASQDPAGGHSLATENAPSQDPGSGSTPLWWEAQKDGVLITLLGSVHVASPEVYPLPADIEQAFEEADFLVVEADLHNPPPPELQSYTLLPPGQSLSGVMDEETYGMLLEHIAFYNMPPALLEPLRPWVVNSVLVVQAAAGMGWSQTPGVDMYFLARALEQGKGIQNLETLMEQVRIFTDRTLDEEIADLRDTLDRASGAEDLQDQLRILLDTWRRGDDAGLSQLLFEQVDLTPGGFGDRVFTQRNRNWAQRTDDWLESSWEAGDRVFFVAGAGHFLGPDNVLDLLEGRGWFIRPRR